MKRAWIVQGGWDGHEPKLTSKRFAGLLVKNGYEVKIWDTLDCLGDLDALMQQDLLVACWTMGEIKHEYLPKVVMADDFESAWDEYMGVYSDCNPEAFIAEMQAELERRVEAAAKYQ